MRKIYLPSSYLKTLTLLFAFLVFAFWANAGTYYSNSANPSLVGNWWANTNGTGAHPANFTTLGDIFILQTGQTCSSTGAWTTGAGVTLQVDGTLNILSNSDVTINGIIFFTNSTSTQVTLNNTGSNGSSTTINGTLKTKNINGVSGANCSLPVSISRQTVALSTNANYEFNNATTAQATLGLPATVNTLTINNASATGVTLTAAVTVSNLIIGNVTSNSVFNDNGKQVTSSGILNLTSGTFNLGITGFATSYPFTSANSIIAAGTTVNYKSNLSQTVAAVNYGNLTNTGNGPRTLSGVIGVKGTFSPSTGTNTITGSTIIFNGITAQTIPAFNYHNLSVTNSGANITLPNSAGNIGIAGAFTPAGTSFGTITNSTIVFNGTVAQSIPAFTFFNLQINNAAGISLAVPANNNVTINQTLTLTAGKVTTGVNKIIVRNDIGGNISTPGPTSWIAGNLEQYISSTGSLTYPIGDGSSYRPLIINFTTLNNTGSLTASVTQTNGQHPQIASSGLNNIKDVQRFWNLLPTLVAGTYDATFGFVAADIIGGANTGSFVVRNYGNPTWTTTTTGTRTSTSTQATGLTTFGDFAIGEVNTLTVSTSPSNATICANGNTSFTSASASTPSLSVKWQRSLDGGTTWSDVDALIDGAVYTTFTSNTLTVNTPAVALNGYQYRSVYSNINGFVNSLPATLIVTTAPVAVIDYPGSPFGSTINTPQSVFHTGTAGGTYSKTAGTGTLFIDALTGDITPSLSTPGTYTVTYTILASGGCPQYTTNTSVTITLAPTATISYTGNPFCQSVTTAQPVTRTGTGNYINNSATAYSAPSGLTIDGSTGEITPSTSTPGTYTVIYNILASPPYPASTSTVDVTITAVPTITTFSYAGGPFCTSDQTPQTVLLDGTGAFMNGVFSSSPGGLVIDPNNGAFTPNGSTGGNYTITYTILASGGCAAVPVTLPSTIGIVIRPTASISYTQSSFCQATTSAGATVNGASGGSFSSSAGLSITNLGVIDPSNSTPGLYDVIYTIPATGPCGVVQITTPITIVASPAGSIDYPNQPYCTAGGVKSVDFTVTSGAYSGGSFSTPVGLSIDAVTGDILPASSTPGMYTITYTTPNCPITSLASIQISAAPTATVNYLLSPFCQTDAISKSADVIGDMSGTFTAPLGLSISANGDITPSSSTPGTYLVTYTIGASGTCPAVIKTTSVIVTPAVGTPTAITISSGIEPTCQIINNITTTTYSSSATSSSGLNWSLSNNAAGAISAAGVMTWANGFSGTVDIQVTANGCNGISSLTFKTVNITPTVGTPTTPTPSATTICQASAPTDYITSATNATSYTWSVTGAGNVISGTGTTATVTWATGFAGSATVSVVANGCNPSAPASTIITVTPTVGTPTTPTPSTTTICQASGPTTYTTSATNATSYTWSVTGTGNTISGTGIIGTVTWAAGFSGSATVSVVANGCGTSIPASTTVGLTPTVGTPTTPTPSATTICQASGPTNYTTSATNATSYTWSVTGAGNTISGSGTIATVTWAAGFSGSATVSMVANGCGTSLPASTTVTVTPTVSTPTAITISAGTEPSCQITATTPTTTYATTATNNTGYNWSLSVPVAGSINSAGVMTWASGFSGTVFIQVTSSGCNGPSAMVTRRVTVNPPFTPTITASPGITICQGQPVTLTASGLNALGSINGGAFDVANPLGWNGASANNNNGDPNSIWGETNGKTYNGVPYNSNAPGTNGRFMIVNGNVTNSFLSSPIFSTVGMTSGSLQYYTAFNFNPGATGLVQISTNGGTTFTTLRQYGPYATATTFGAPNNGFVIESIPLDAYLGLSNLKVRFLYNGNNGSNWALDNVTVPASFQPVTYSWSTSGYASTGQTITVSPTDTTSYSIISSMGGCTATTTTVTVNVNKPIVITAQPSSTTFCVGSNATISMTATGTSVSYQWQVSTNGATGTFADVVNGGAYSGYSGINSTTLIFTAPPITLSTNYYRVIINTPFCGSLASSPAALKYSNVWMGTTDNKWNTASNWSDGNLPSIACQVVHIPSRSNQPTLSATTPATIPVITDLQIYSSAVLTVTNATMKIGGAITNNGIFDVSNGSLDFNGTSTQNIAGSFFLGNTLKDLIVSNPAGVNVSSVAGNPLNIKGDLSFGNVNNANLNTGNNIVLLSTANSTARVADINNGVTNGVVNNTGNKFTGQVTVQRFYPATRAWRLVTSPLSNTGSIFKNWQDSGKNRPGVGVLVTGSPVANGLDPSQLNNSSLKWGSNITPVLDTKNMMLSGSSPNAANIGYFLFVRGDRDPANTIAPNTNITTLSSKGLLQTGPQKFATSPTPGSFSLIGNPYASPVDFSKLTRVGVVNRFYAWDPRLNVVGGYVTVDDYSGSGNYSYSVQGPGGQDLNIQSSQAIFVQTDSSNVPPSIQFNEADKTTNNNLAMFRPTTPTGTGSAVQSLRINLYLANSPNAIFADGALAEFYAQAHAGFTQEDALKFININETVSLFRDGRSLSIERRPFITSNDTLFLRLTRTTQRNYNLELVPDNFDPTMTAFLEDKYKGTLTPLIIAGKTNYSFSIDGVAASALADRFHIIFKLAKVLPVSFKTIKAYQQQSNISVEWDVENEININKYEVEKSADGINFVKVNSTSATGANGSSAHYQWLDLNPSAGDNYYRVRSIGKDGKYEFSKVVVVKMANVLSDIRVYPNPVTTNNIGVEFKNMPVGIYHAKLLNTVGQTMLKKQISHAAGTSIESIQPVRKLIAGMYQLEIVSPDKTIMTLKVIVE